MDKTTITNLRPAEYEFTFVVTDKTAGLTRVKRVAQTLDAAYATILADYGYGELSCVNPA